MKSAKMTLMITAAGIILGLSGCVVHTALPPVDAENYYYPAADYLAPEPFYGAGSVVVGGVPYGYTNWNSYYYPYYDHTLDHRSSLFNTGYRSEFYWPASGPNYKPAPIHGSPAAPVFTLKPQHQAPVALKPQPAPPVASKPQPVPPGIQKPQQPAPPAVSKPQQPGPPVASKPQQPPPVAQKPEQALPVAPKPQPAPVVSQRPQPAPLATPRPQPPAVSQRPEQIPPVTPRQQSAPSVSQRPQPVPEARRSEPAVAQRPAVNENRGSLSPSGGQNNSGRNNQRQDHGHDRGRGR